MKYFQKYIQKSSTEVDQTVASSRLEKIKKEMIKKAKKLLKLKVDTGIDQRTVVSGIAQFFEPEDIVGKQVSILI